MPKHTTRREPTPLHLMRAHISAYSDGLRGKELEDVTRRLFDADAFSDWLQGVHDGQRPE